MKKPNIILEGPDGAGKTYTANILVTKYGYSYRHEGPPPQGLDLLTHFEVLLESYPQPFVLDRSAIGEIVYGPILRGRALLTTEEVQEYVKCFRRRFDGLSYLLLPSRVQVLGRWDDKRRVGKEHILDVAVWERTYEEWQKLSAANQKLELFDMVWRGWDLPVDSITSRNIVTWKDVGL